MKICLNLKLKNNFGDFFPPCKYKCDLTVVAVGPHPRIFWSDHPLIPQKANLNSHSWITSVASKGFFHRQVVVLYCVGN